MNAAFRAGCLLAEGRSLREIGAALSLSEEELLALLDTEELVEAYRRSIRLRQMAGYGLALQRLAGYLNAENDANAIKAAHEALGLMDDLGEAPFRLEETEDRG